MPSIYKRGNIWWVRISIRGKMTREPGGPDKRQAEAKLADLIQERDAAKYGAVIRNISWDAFKKKYLEYHKSKAPNTRNVDLRAIRSLERFDCPFKAEDLSTELLDRWKACCVERGYAPATINRDLSALKAMRAKGVEWGYIRAKLGKVPPVPEPDDNPEFFSKEEFPLLLKACKITFPEKAEASPWCWKTAAMIGVFAGLRPSEIYWLPWAHIDLEKRLIKIRTYKENGRSVWVPKSYETRDVPMCKRLYEYLKTLKRDGPWVIGHRPTAQSFTAYFARLVREAGLNGGLQKCRHTFASWLVQDGIDLWVVSKLLGHKSVKHTTKYAKLAPHNFAKAVSVLD